MAKEVTAAKVRQAQHAIGRRNLRTALVLKLRQRAQAQRGNKVGAASRNVTDTMDTVPDHERAGYPVVVGRVKPKDWRTKEGKHVFVDLTRVSWLPDDWGQGVKMTNEIARSRPGAGGSYTVWVGPEGHVCYHKFAVEKIVGRKLSRMDGFNGMLRQACAQRKMTDQQAFFRLLAAKERAILPKAGALHFCVVSARRTRTAEGLKDIATVEAQFKHADVKPTWYVDKESLQEYRNLGLDAVVGGKLTEARNLCLKDAAKKGKACVQVSDDISRWEYAEGDRATERTDEAVNAAYAAAKIHVVSPVAAARFLLAKLRSACRGSAGPQLAGIYPLGSCSRAFGGEEFTGHNFIIGDFFVVDRSPVRFDMNMKLKEDYDFTCAHIAKHGSVLRCNRMTLSVKHYSNAGGAVAVRNSEEEQRNIAILTRKWPGAFRQNPKRKNEVILQWRKGRAEEEEDEDTDSAVDCQSRLPAASARSGRRGLATKAKHVKKDLATKAKKPRRPTEFRPTSVISRGPATPRTEYIRNRCKAAVGKKLREVLNAMSYKGASGVPRTYSLPDLRYDLGCKALALR